MPASFAPTGTLTPKGFLGTSATGTPRGTLPRPLPKPPNWPSHQTCLKQGPSATVGIIRLLNTCSALW